MAKRGLLGMAAVTTVALASVFSVSGAGPAEAAFPGGNGKIVYVWSDSGLHELRQMGEGLWPKGFPGNPSIGVEAPDWSADGTRLAFSDEGPDDSSGVSDGSYDIFATDAAGENPVNLTNSPGHHDRGPAWFPSGKKIAFVSSQSPGEGSGIFEVTLGEDGQPVGEPTLLTGSGGRYDSPAISPDGEKMIFANDRDGDYEVYVMRAAPEGPDNRPVKLTENGEYDSEPDWSPDGAKIAYTASSGETWEIFTMNADGSSKTNLTNDPARDYSPAWAPDGETIAFVSNRIKHNRIDHRRLWRMGADGSGPAALTRADPDGYGAPLDPTWQPLPGGAPVDDGAAPDTAVIRYMDSASGDYESTVLLDITSSEPLRSTYECSLDGAEFAPCSPPQRLVGLATGEHSFRVRATDEAGNVDPTPAETSFTVDNTPPETIVDSGPPRHTSSRSATFRFSSDDPHVLFRCTLDGVAQVRYCPSPTTFDGLSDGKHTFRVWAWDHTAENEDSSPAVYEWTVDTTTPDTTISSGPPALARSVKAAFAFSSSEPGSTYQCSLDGSAYSACSSPKVYTGLKNGAHRFEVRATDAAGNADATPAQKTWRVDTARPSGRATVNGGAATTRGRKVSLSLRASDPAPASGVSQVRVRNAGRAWSAWRPYAKRVSWTLTAGAGTKTVYVQYRDKAGNPSRVASDRITYRP